MKFTTYLNERISAAFLGSRNIVSMRWNAYTLTHTHTHERAERERARARAREKEREGERERERENKKDNGQVLNKIWCWPVADIHGITHTDSRAQRQRDSLSDRQNTKGYM